MEEPISPIVLTLAEIDGLLAELRGLDARIKREEAAHSEKQVALDTAFAAKVAPDKNRRAQVEQTVREWAQAHSGQCPAKLTHGTVLVRATPPSVRLLTSAKEVIKRIKAVGVLGCLRVEEAIDLHAVKALTDAERRAIGVELVSKSTITINLA